MGTVLGVPPVGAIVYWGLGDLYFGNYLDFVLRVQVQVHGKRLGHERKREACD